MRRMFFLLLPFLLTFVFSLYGEEAPKDSLFPSGLLSEGQSYHYWKDFVNMLITLLFVLGLVFVSVWFLKKMMRSRMRQLNRTTGIKVLERRALTPKSSLYLISILGKGVVIAESPAGIECITELSMEKDVETLLEEKALEANAAPSTSFATLLQKKMDLFRNFRKAENK